MKTLVILPTLKEKLNLEILLPKIFSLNLNYQIFIYLIDDNSQDGTKELIENFKNQNQPIEILSRPTKMGLGTAYISGYEFAKKHNFDIAITMDSDLSHDPVVICKLIKTIENGADLAIGSRYVEGGKIIGWPIHRKILSHGANILSQKILNLPIHDCTSGFRAYSLKAYSHLLKEPFYSNGYALLEEMLFSLYHHGINIVEVPICFTERRYGQSKISKHEIARGAAMLGRKLVKRLSGKRWLKSAKIITQRKCPII